MRIERVALRRITLPLVSPFRTSLGIEYDKPALLVQVSTPDAEGWGECVAGADPSHSSEYIDSVEDVLRRHLIPPLLAADAIALGACQIVNIKPGRVGGYLEARRIHDVCAASGVPVWCGGMLETGLGLGVARIPDLLAEVTTSVQDLTRSR